MFLQEFSLTAGIIAMTPGAPPLPPLRLVGSAP
jgi:hypothetical protein